MDGDDFGRNGCSGRFDWGDYVVWGAEEIKPLGYRPKIITIQKVGTLFTIALIGKNILRIIELAGEGGDCIQ